MQLSSAAIIMAKANRRQSIDCTGNYFIAKFPLPQTLLFLTVFERRLPIVTNPLSVDKFYAARKYFHLIGSG